MIPRYARGLPPEVLIGCPITSERIEKYLPGWLEHAHRAARIAEVDYEFIFLKPSSVATPEIEFKTGSWWLNLDEEDVAAGGDRDGTYWDYGANSKRIPHMVEVRNHLLEEVRGIGPDFFLSLDSDIFMAPEALKNALGTYRAHQPKCWAVGLKAYLQPTSRYAPNVAQVRGNHLTRPDSNGVMIADVIMAAKLMDPRAYGVDYQMANQGEDIGWSQAVRESGGQLMWDGRVCSKHVMSDKWLDRVDPRCGY